MTRSTPQNTHRCWSNQHVNDVKRLCEGDPAITKLFRPSLVEKDAKILVERTKIGQEASAQQYITYQSAKTRQLPSSCIYSLSDKHRHLTTTQLSLIHI